MEQIQTRCDFIGIRGTQQSSNHNRDFALVTDTANRNNVSCCVTTAENDRILTVVAPGTNPRCLIAVSFDLGRTTDCQEEVRQMDATLPSAIRKRAYRLSGGKLAGNGSAGQYTSQPSEYKARTYEVHHKLFS